MTAAITDALVRDWLSARSLARGLPLPVADYGAYRVDTGAPDEIKRWVFAAPGPGIGALARAIHAPGYLIKLCGPVTQLQPLLPPGWQVKDSGYMMAGPGIGAVLPASPAGYTVALDQHGPVRHVRILAADGALAASGYAAETDAACVLDRIATDPAHRRRGLATLVVQTLLSRKRSPAVPELLVATEAGCALYRTLGWRILSPYSTGHAAVAQNGDNSYPKQRVDS